MQDALIRAFSDPEFQAKLKGALSEAGSDPLSKSRLRHQLCLPVQTPIVRQFGFDSVADSIEAFTEDLNADPEVAERRRVLDGLVGVHAEDEAQSRYQMMISVMQVFAAVPSQHVALFQKSTIAPAVPSEEDRRRSGSLQRSGSLVLRRSFSVEGGRKALKSSPSPAPAPRALRRHRSASKTKRPGALVPFLSRDDAIAMQDELIAELEKPEVQHYLWRALSMVGPDKSARCRMRQTLLVPLQLPIVRNFGFVDVGECMLAFTPQLNRDPEIAMRRARLGELVNPTGFKGRGDEHPGSAAEPWRQVELGPMPGQLWRVVGGQKLGGIVARRGKELSSALLGTRGHSQLLARGAVVQELELCGERLHYKKVSGEGPEFGWVSLQSIKGHGLLERVTEELQVLDGEEASVRVGPDEVHNVACVVKEGGTIEVWKRHNGMGDRGDFAQLTPKQVWELSKVSRLKPFEEAYVMLNSSVKPLPDKAWAEEDSEPEVLPVTNG